MRRQATWGVRRRAVVSALVITTLALGVGGALLMWILQTRLQSGIGSDVITLSRDLAASYTDTTEVGPPEARPVRSHALVIQILDAQGTVLSSTAPAYDDVPLDGPHNDNTAHRGTADGESTELLVASRTFQRAGTTYSVVVASSTEGVEETIRTVAILLVATLPVLLGAVAVGTWVLVGRSLRSVGDITTTVRRIRRGQLAERVAVPSTNDEIALLATTMNDMLARIEEADETQRRFVSDASHDLRTPIASISAAVEVAASEGTLQSWEDMAPVIGHEAARMQHLVDGLLTLARADDQRLELRRVPVDLDDLLSSEAASLRARTELDVTLRLHPVQVVCDPRRTAQIVENLLQNAERYAVRRIELRCAPDGDEGRIEICNDGPPVPPEDRERIFDRFVRLDSSRTQATQQSSGLGLSIARELTEAQGGRLYTDVDEGGLCRFVVLLPAQPGLSGTDDDDLDEGDDR
ncbi:sensor histidine kinase [Cumulibacter manganitolerans]|uniref:sensor histidine kinase n=1 Tax=Cumulibacter manganitolerans TaxID=1884992 RepID=UPI001E4D9BD4|nr:HAMP domain-containing sensor histidine kinase [Cumulibacter manganitolerans]